MEALLILKNDNSILLKEADTGEAIVIMDKDYYKDKILEIVPDKTYYNKEPKQPEEAIMDKIKTLIKDYFTDKEKDYLCNSVIKRSNFYGLPQILKSP
ncbi:Hypothetical predicted protein [Octopus vulgaris]|uniref:Uncharacterized protein n=1 Tax=Octopus vulgaris TaxID=6645 RepID=A0AA36F6F8_OCTVU|nr:Hypothetical predicted protein [Octopus vulgaris]